MIALANITLYGVVLSMIGRVEIAMTTSKMVHFLSRSRPAEVRSLAALAVGEVTMRQAALAQPVCHVTGTDAIPPERG